MLITGYRIKEPAIILATLTLFINFGMHDFWNEYPNTDAGHEMQNFIKNLGIFAGLLVLSASNNVSQWRLFNKSL
jgi:putative oxidoreductase